jgi:hypothetical protein
MLNIYGRWYPAPNSRTTKEFVDDAQQLTQLERDKVKEIRLRNLGMSAFPIELFVLFSNIRVIDLDHDTFSMIPRDVGKLVQLRVLYLLNNNICTLPSTMTKLTNLYALYLHGNPQFPRKVLQKEMGLNQIVAYFEPPRRSATVLVGLGNLKRSQILGTFYVPIEFILEIARLVCSSHANSKWEPARSDQ